MALEPRQRHNQPRQPTAWTSPALWETQTERNSGRKKCRKGEKLNSNSLLRAGRSPEQTAPRAQPSHPVKDHREGRGDCKQGQQVSQQGISESQGTPLHPPPQPDDGNQDRNPKPQDTPTPAGHPGQKEKNRPAPPHQTERDEQKVEQDHLPGRRPGHIKTQPEEQNEQGNADPQPADNP